VDIDPEKSKWGSAGRSVALAAIPGITPEPPTLVHHGFVTLKIYCRRSRRLAGIPQIGELRPLRSCGRSHAAH
jgi:hypothetical protein